MNFKVQRAGLKGSNCLRAIACPYLLLAKRLCFFNCVPGRGSVLNVKGDVEMDALVMDGKTLASGAVSAVRNLANPIQLARLVMDKVRRK